MPLCNAHLKKNGQPCTSNARPGTERCGRHPLEARPPRVPAVVLPENQCVGPGRLGAPRCLKAKIPDDPHSECAMHHRQRVRRLLAIVLPENQCVGRGVRGAPRCLKAKIPDDPHNECTTHHRQRLRREQVRARWMRFREIWPVSGMNIFHALMEVDGVLQGVAHFFTRQAVHEMARIGLTEAEAIVAVHPMLVDTIQRMTRNRVPDTRPELQRLAADPQSVHTRHVTSQTNKNLELLFATRIPEGQHTMPEIRATWTEIYTIPGRGVGDNQYEDMQKWYDAATCRTVNDWLYRRVLDHLWARIKGVDKCDVRRELYKRLQQECAESYMMCCEGHISRLANVMCGFDEEFCPAASVGEILQQRMSVISTIENVAERFRQATALMAELNIPQEEAVPWFDAIAEEETV